MGRGGWRRGGQGEVDGGEVDGGEVDGERWGAHYDYVLCNLQQVVIH